ncbi:MAG: OmpA family protein [Comamonas sp.]
MSSQNDDRDERFALGLIFALITLVVLSVLGFGAYKGVHGAKAGAAQGVVKAQAAGGQAAGAAAGAAGAAGAAAGAGGAAAGAGGAAAGGAAAGAAVEVDEARVLVENGVVKFYFATAKAELAPGANEALADVVAAAKAGKRAVISGYTDATGDADKNAELAKQRAIAVREALAALGVAEDKLDLRKPESVNATGSNAEARRVEVKIGE